MLQQYLSWLWIYNILWPFLVFDVDVQELNSNYRKVEEIYLRSTYGRKKQFLVQPGGVQKSNTNPCPTNYFWSILTSRHHHIKLLPNTNFWYTLFKKVGTTQQMVLHTNYWGAIFKNKRTTFKLLYTDIFLCHYKYTSIYTYFNSNLLNFLHSESNCH